MFIDLILIRWLIRFLIFIIIIPFWSIAYLFCLIYSGFKKKNKVPHLVWGTDPIISNKYWSESLKRSGYFSETLMNGHYSINNRNDFDRYFDDLFPWFK